jgi:hypothetical protein
VLKIHVGHTVTFPDTVLAKSRIFDKWVKKTAVLGVFRVLASPKMVLGYPQIIPGYPKVLGGDPMTPTSWTRQKDVTKSKSVILNLVSGTRIWVRVRAVNPAGESAWSAPATKIMP